MKEINSITLEIISNGITSIADHSFYRTAIKATPDLSGVAVIGDYAFARSAIESVVIPEGVTEFDVSVTWTDLEGNSNTSDVRTITL